MASAMDSIMRQYYSGPSGGSAPSNPMMSANIGQGLTPNPIAQPFTPSAFGPLVTPRMRMGSYIEPAPVSAFMGGPPMLQQPAMPMGEPGYSGAAGAMVPTAAEAMARNMMVRPPMLMGAPNPMLSAPQFQSPMMTNMEPGYSGAAGAMVPTAAEAARPSLPGRTPGFLDQLLSGTDYQSNSMPVDIRAQGPSMPGQEMPIQSINYGDPNSAADFFRADRLAMQNPGVPGFLGGF